MDAPAVLPLLMDPALYYALILQPTFADITPEFNGSYDSLLSEFTVMPNVALGLGQPLVDITNNVGILQRKDRSCNTNWKTVGGTANRRIYVSELYGAVKNCEEQFYDGCWKDFREANATFKNFIVKFFGQAISTDLVTNAWFGDVARADDTASGVGWSWNKFQGIISQIAKYITAGTIPAGQTFSVSYTGVGGTMTPTDAYNNLKKLFESRSALMKAMPDMNLGIYLDYNWAYQYGEYLKSLGNNTIFAIDYIQNGVPVFRYNGVPIFVMNLWNPILNALNGGTDANMGIMTIRRNFVFGTNKKYGGGPDLDSQQALRVWYDEHDEVWKYKMHLAGGTEIISPQNIVFAITNSAME